MKYTIKNENIQSFDEENNKYLKVPSFLKCFINTESEIIYSFDNVKIINFIGDLQEIENARCCPSCNSTMHINKSFGKSLSLVTYIQHQ